VLRSAFPDPTDRARRVLDTTDAWFVDRYGEGVTGGSSTGSGAW